LKESSKPKQSNRSLRAVYAPGMDMRYDHYLHCVSYVLCRICPCRATD